jgi:hypothetical protein
MLYYCRALGNHLKEDKSCSYLKNTLATSKLKADVYKSALTRFLILEHDKINGMSCPIVINDETCDHNSGDRGSRPS